MLTANSLLDVSGGIGGGAGGRIFLEGASSLKNHGHNNLRTNGGQGASGGTDGTLRFVRPSYLESLEYTTGTILIDTDSGTLTHSNGDLAYGLIEDRSSWTIVVPYGPIRSAVSASRRLTLAVVSS